jgi:hypothetical protein
MSLPTPRCKQGDLAFIIKAIRPSNIGLIVLVEEYVGYFQRGEEYYYGGLRLIAYDTGHAWKVTSSSKSIDTIDGKSNFALTIDTWLTPIKGLPEDEENLYEDLEIEDRFTV